MYKFALRFQYKLFFAATLVCSCCIPLFAQNTQIRIDGLEKEVRVLRDSAGINHIFAETEADLFFSQGYLAAKDRLFQFEIWRRQATGTMAEIFGERELARDQGVRLFKYRGAKSTELNHYHPRGEQIIESFVRGVNAYIAEARANPALLPLEFKLLNILPEPWTWEVVISRHQGLLENVKDELSFSRMVSMIGPEKTAFIHYFHPNRPDLSLHPNIPKELLEKDILAPYNAFRAPLKFLPEDIQASYRAGIEDLSLLATTEEEGIESLERAHDGSNNWVIHGSRTESGFPMLANDPHRSIAVPSLRYWVHLHGPGWDVVGGGEPVIPGVSIGHNPQGAWGLTIFETDMEDLRVYDLDPNDPTRYFHAGKWKKMDTVSDTILVKNVGKKIVLHHYTVHGPVTFVDTLLHKAVAVECAWLRAGGAPYLASLRMGQAKSWEEFREACKYNHVPAENMVWADKEGNIGWQATGISPIRRKHSGLVATLGDGSMDWDGILPMLDRPHSMNPKEGFIVTANENVSPAYYPFPEALGYEWADAFRGDRIRQVLGKTEKASLPLMQQLQNDHQALPARILVPMLTNLQLQEKRLSDMQLLLNQWDKNLEAGSIPAAIYIMWERTIREDLKPLVVPEAVHDLYGQIQMTKVLEWMSHPEMVFEANPQQRRDSFLITTFEKAISKLEIKLGPDIQKWQYGQNAYKHALLRHPLSALVKPEIQQLLDFGPAPRGGYSFSPSATGYGDNNNFGASFRLIVDTADWEKSRGTNTPGQSGNPASPFYGNLFPLWAKDQYFPVYFEGTMIEKAAVENILLSPKNE
ncbi:Penicillin acylase (Penicillin amidase) [Mariniradius saccharolyticus AK6]|uniref:Penicillin acylase (Penicillin amidase) n=1 Tax=Mariniradius saccharolyticus AK6 TaxID=1239962 RepID=M7YD67_9BACT|nr:penicillin acylase family protein [Mariniradius saccharolyticus]EMS35121.1 Penicillin acylase (Penicillin amidase) [Mariniradius saccharolyticus AK6]